MSQEISDYVLCLEYQKKLESMFLAKALFDNVAETPNELAFRRGDVITVIGQDSVGGGLGGWWLCSFRGRQGIAPANRLKILSGLMEETAVTKGVINQHNPVSGSLRDYDVPPSRYNSPRTVPSSGPSIYDTPTTTPASTNSTPFNTTTNPSATPVSPASFYDTPPSSNRASVDRSSPCRSQRASMDSVCSASSQSLPSTSNTSDSINRSAFPANTMSSFYEIPPSSKQASSKRSPPPRSQHPSVDSVLFAASQALPVSRDQYQQQPLYQRPTSSKRWSAGSGGLRLSESACGKICGWDSGNSNFPTGKNHYQRPPGSKRVFVEVMLSDDHTVYDLRASGHPLEKVGGSTYDVPNPRSRDQSRDCTRSWSRGSMLPTASSDSCTSANSPHLVSNRHSSGASLSQVVSSRHSTGASLSQVVSNCHSSGANLSQVVSNRHSNGASLSEVVSNRHSTGASLSQVVSNRHSTGASLSQVVSNRHSTGASLSEVVSNCHSSGTSLSEVVSNRHSTGASLSEVVSNRHSSGASLSHVVSNRHSTGASLSQEVSNRHYSGASLSGGTLPCLDDSLRETSRLTSSDSRASKQLSLDSGSEGLYDIPASVCHNSTCPQPSPVPDCSTPLSVFTKGDHSQVDIQRCHSLDHTPDNYYDFPHNNALEVSKTSAQSGSSSTSAICYNLNPMYDIPHQTIRYSIKSAGSNSSEDSLRLSSCSMDSYSSGAVIYCLAGGMYEELQLGVDSATNLLMKLQDNFTQSASRVLLFVSSSWRTKEYLQSNVCDIKAACMEMKNAMMKFMEFAQGTLVNSTLLSDRKLIKQLMKQVTHLQNQLKAMSEALGCLGDMEWQVALLAEPLKPAQKDHLDTIICLAKDLTPDVKKLVSLIHGNSSLLFKRPSDMAAPSPGSETVHAVSKPPISPKPDIPKAGAGKSGAKAAMPRSRSIQQRPLPSPPVSKSGAQLSPTPVAQTPPLLQTSSRAILNDSASGTEGVQRWRIADDNDGDKDYSDLQEDYDYVQLEARDVLAQQRIKTQLQERSEYKKILKDIDEEVELPDIPAPHKKQSSVTVGKSLGKDTCPEIIPKPIHHTERVFADLGEKQSDTNKALTNKDIRQTISSHADIPNGLLNTKTDSQEAPRISEYNKNGSRTHSHCSPSSNFGVTTTVLEPSDKNVLGYYSGQLDTHSTLLTNAIDAFIASIDKKGPPNVFISHVKFVIVTAYKLIYISDSLHRSLVNGELGNRVVCCASHLCECIRAAVQATKAAALQFPSACAVQEMVDRVVDVAHAAHELKLVIRQASALGGI